MRCEAWADGREGGWESRNWDANFTPATQLLCDLRVLSLCSVLSGTLSLFVVFK